MSNNETAKTAYIAGPITGVPYYRENFSRAARYVKRLGFGTVLNPAELPRTLRNDQAMKICFAMINVSDVVFFIPEWERSVGAKLEMAYAKYMNKEINYLPAKP